MSLYYPPVMYSNASPSAVTVGASPFGIQNTDASPMCLLISGGTVTTIEYSRNGSTFYLAGLLAGMYNLNPRDRLRIAYLIAPTITKIPM
ncbi:hypothetical protein D3C71_1035410 [compost metagenome]